jgi:Lon protease-like protein
MLELVCGAESEVKVRRTIGQESRSRCVTTTSEGFVALLPIFPLDVVLFPGVPLPLHIFEPRYKEMIGECLEERKAFGIVRVQDEGISQIGCTAEIIAVTKKHEDGKLDIVTEGRARFELLELNQERSFLRAEVLFVPDEPGKPNEIEKQRAIDLHQEILRLAGAQQSLDEGSDTPLSYQMAGSLPLDADFKQTLLATRAESERIQAIIKYFETVRRAVIVRHKASGNGHAH